MVLKPWSVFGGQSFLLPCGSQGLDSGRQARQQVSLPTDRSISPRLGSAEDRHLFLPALHPLRAPELQNPV